jgi:hypothetical protein
MCHPRQIGASDALPLQRFRQPGGNHLSPGVNTEENSIVTAMQGLESYQLKKLGKNYGFNPSP